MEKLLIVVLVLCLFTITVNADTAIPCYFYGTLGDGHLYRPTAFASWYFPPDIPLTVQPDFPGIALAGYAPGTLVKLTIVDLPDWAWEELRNELIGRSVIAAVADRPGGCVCDMWPQTFRLLSGNRLWIGLMYVTMQVIATP